MSKDKVSVLFVCMGNICRSPTAEGVFRQHVANAGLSETIRTDSAGTHAYHIGESPDARASKAAAKRGYDLSDLRARKVIAEDFKTFDYVLAMDEDNYHNLSAICPNGYEERLTLFLAFADKAERNDVPDPYYGGPKGFEYVLDLVEDAAQGLLRDIQRNKLS